MQLFATLLLTGFLGSFVPGHATESPAAGRSCLTPLLRSLQTGQFVPLSTEFGQTSITLEAQLQGLQHGGVIRWTPDETKELNRNLVRFHGVERQGPKIPTFDRGQQLGPANVRIREIRFSLANADNRSGQSTVLGNAQALRDGTLSIQSLPPIRVWRDTEGRIWALDDHRLAAMRLSGRLDEVPVQFVSEDMVRTQGFKFSTESEGRSIFVTVESPTAPPRAVLIGDDNLPAETPHIQGVLPRPTQTSTPASNLIKGILTNIPNEQRAAWLQARGAAHIERIKEYAHEISSAYATLEGREVRNLGLSYARFGDFGGRGKTYDSVLTKLLRKDFSAFTNGQPGIDRLNRSLEAIGDGIGARLTLRANANGLIEPRLIQDFVDQVVIDIRNGNRVTEILNYRPRNGAAPPYLNDAQVQQIVRADADYLAHLRQTGGPDAMIPQPIVVRNSATDGVASGYTAFHMNIRYRSGVQAEFQIRGPRVSQTAEIEHLFYDIKAGKPLGERYLRIPAFARAAEDYRGLSEVQRNLFNRYIEQRMIYARRIESGEIPATTIAPGLPLGLPPSISLDNLALHVSH